MKILLVYVASPCNIIKMYIRSIAFDFRIIRYMHPIQVQPICEVSFTLAKTSVFVIYCKKCHKILISTQRNKHHL